MFSAQGRAWIGLSALLAAVFMSILDVFITVSAAPTIRVDLGVGATGIQMILAAYNLSFGLLLVTGGRMGDIWGRKRIFLAGLSLFVVASLVASLAATTSLLITARLVQGAAAGLLMPQIFSVIQASFEDGERGKAFGAFAVVSGIAATTAQLLGGLLLEINLFGLGWRIIFLINVPIGLAALVVAHALVPESRAPGSNHLTLDGVGVSLFALGLVSVTLPLTLGAEAGMPLWAWISLAMTLPLFWLFSRWQSFRVAAGRTPLIAPSLMRNRAFVFGNAAAFLFYINNVALFVALPLLVQEGFGYSALASGLLFMPLALSFSLSAHWVGRMVHQAGEQIVRKGVLIQILGYFLLSAPLLMTEPPSGLGWLVPGAILSGVGMGFIQPVINHQSLAQVTPDEVGSASGVLNTSFELGAGVGSLLAGILFMRALGSSATGYVEAFVASLGMAGLLLCGIALACARMRTDVGKRSTKDPDGVMAAAE